VVNLDQVLRQTTNAEDMTDWAGFLSGLLPLSSYTSPEEAFIQSINGNWWHLSYSVQPVSRGGTGNGTVAYGEMLYGTGNDTMERLGAATEDNSFLMFSSGKPVWAGAGDATGNTSILRVATGSYTGNGSNGRRIDFGVTPKMVHISTPSGCWKNSYGGSMMIEWSDYPVTLAQNCVGTAQYEVYVDNGVANYSETVKLSGSGATLGTYFCNRSGITYNWVAIY
jgi:hypothetical protein